jgi:hypothetical protein
VLFCASPHFKVKKQHLSNNSILQYSYYYPQLQTSIKNKNAQYQRESRERKRKGAVDTLSPHDSHFQYTLSHVLRARLEYLQTHYQIREQDFLNFDAIQQASQCVVRVIHSKTDYGLMIFADSRYNRQDKRGKLPKWILQFMADSYLNLSTKMAIAHVKQFLRLMGQPT